MSLFVMLEIRLMDRRVHPPASDGRVWPLPLMERDIPGPNSRFVQVRGNAMHLDKFKTTPYALPRSLTWLRYGVDTISVAEQVGDGAR
jgi:hypothetical protein